MDFCYYFRAAKSAFEFELQWPNQDGYDIDLGNPC